MNRRVILMAVGSMVMLTAVFTAIHCHRDFQMDQAKFNVDVIERFLEIYRSEQKQNPLRLGNMDSFRVISYKDGLAMDFKDLRSGIWRGYRYDYQRISSDKFVLSASPQGLFSPRVEVGITEEGLLRVNDHQVDRDADGYGEVQKWDIVERHQDVHSWYK